MKTIDLLQALSAESVNYVLVGGMAVQLHGFLRMTYDIDLVLAMDQTNLSRFVATAKRLGLSPVAPVPLESLENSRLLDQWFREKGMLAFALRESGAGGSVIDVLIKPDVDYERLSSQAFVAQLARCTLKVASVEHLLEMKRISNRPKDQMDILALEKIKRGEDPNA